MAVSLSPTALVTLAQAREWVLNDAADSSKDDLLTLLINAATDRLERETGRTFVTRAITELLSGDGAGRTLCLRGRPVTSVASLTVDTIAVDASAYVLNGARGYLSLSSSVFSKGALNVAITYTAGYVLTDPALGDAIDLCLQLIKREYQLKSKGGQSFQSVTVGGSSFMMRDTLPEDVKRAIATLRDTRFG